MAHAVLMDFFGFRFHARFWLDEAKTQELKLERQEGTEMKRIGFAEIKHTPIGLEFWTGQVVGQPMLAKLLHEAKVVEVFLFQRMAHAPARVITFDLGHPVDRSPLMVGLDAASSSIALDGVVFRAAKCIGVEERVVEEDWANQPLALDRRS